MECAVEPGPLEYAKTRSSGVCCAECSGQCTCPWSCRQKFRHFEWHRKPSRSHRLERWTFQSYTNVYTLSPLTLRWTFQSHSRGRYPSTCLFAMVPQLQFTDNVADISVAPAVTYVASASCHLRSACGELHCANTGASGDICSNPHESHVAPRTDSHSSGDPENDSESTGPEHRQDCGRASRPSGADGTGSISEQGCRHTRCGSTLGAHGPDDAENG